MGLSLGAPVAPVLVFHYWYTPAAPRLSTIELRNSWISRDADLDGAVARERPIAESLSLPSPRPRRYDQRIYFAPLPLRPPTGLANHAALRFRLPLSRCSRPGPRRGLGGDTNRGRVLRESSAAASGGALPGL